MTPPRLALPGKATWFTWCFVILAALFVPMGYLTLSLGHLKGAMEASAEINGDLLSRVITSNPRLWRFETTRLEELLARRGQAGIAERRRLYDEQGRLVCESANPLPAPRLSISRPVRDGGEVTGRLEITRSALPLLLRTGLLSVLGLAAGLALRRWLPFQDVLAMVTKLHEANEFLVRVMEGCSHALVVLDGAGRINLCNGHFAALLGRPAEDLLGQVLAEQFSAECIPAIQAGLADLGSGGAQQLRLETRLRSPSAGMRQLDFGALPIRAAGVVTGVVISLDDVTEQRKAEGLRRALAEKVQKAQRMQSLGSLAGGVAHDMNNVLGAILGLASAHLEQEPAGSAAAKAFGIIAKAAERGGKVVHNLLGFARERPAELRRLDLNQLIRDQAQLLDLTRRAQVTLELQLERELRPILGDPSALGNVLMNLCVNAMDAMPEGGVLTLRTRNLGPDWIEWQVEDTGQGMGPEVLERAMEPFFTTKEVGKGTGLGLATAYGTVVAHQGRIELLSEPGRGTRVTLTFPAECRSSLEAAG